MSEEFDKLWEERKKKEIKGVLEKYNYDPVKLAEAIIELESSLLDANEQNDLLLSDL
jgi:hypothetical protein